MAAKRTTPLFTTAALLLVLTALPAVGQEATPQVGGDYQGGDYGRVSDAGQGVEVLRASWQEQTNVKDEAGINSPIFPGDEVLTGADQQVEIQLAGGSLVWVDEISRLEFASLPDPYSDVPDNAVLKLSEGSLRMSARIAGDSDFRIDTPAASVYPLDNAEFRVDVGPSGRTTISSHRGVIEVAANGGSVLVRSGTRSIVSPGSLPLNPEPFHSFASDELDRYADSREALYKGSDSIAGGGDAYRELPDEVRPYYQELSANGSWSHVDDYGYVWRPVGVAKDWRPYSAGYWGYGPQGYFWISNEPWGWAPYHYGRWSYISGHGWGWTAGSVFGGAWVSWSWGSASVGWGPLDYWDYPAYHYAPHHGYYGWNYVSYQHFHGHDYHHHYQSWDHVNHHGHRSAVVTRPPNVSPRRLASSEGARRTAVERSRASSSRIDPDARSRRPENGFRNRENQVTRVSRRTERAADSAPAGRSRREPNIRSTQRESRVRSTQRESFRGGSMERSRNSGGRDRLPVSSTRRSSTAASPDKERRSPAARRSGSASSGTRGQSVAPRSRGTNSGSRVDGRMRDLFRKVSKPRQTKETPSSAGSSARSSSGKKTSVRSKPRPTSTRSRSTTPRRSSSPSSVRGRTGGSGGTKRETPAASRGRSNSGSGKKSVSRSGGNRSKSNPSRVSRSKSSPSKGSSTKSRSSKGGSSSRSRSKGRSSRSGGRRR